MQNHIEYMHMLLDELNAPFHRYMYDKLFWDSKMFGLVGPRGVGKTTMFLQRIKENYQPGEALYLAADRVDIFGDTLLGLADQFYKAGGKYLFIDEVHKYTNWSTELKLIHDGYKDLHVFFTGSSILDIQEGQADLSRRAPIYTMQGLSYREYLAINHGINCPVFSLDEILAGKANSAIKRPLAHFPDYLKTGYYPFDSDAEFQRKLEQVINQTLETDIPLYANMSAAVGLKLKKLMGVVSTLVPYKPNMTELARQIQVSRNDMGNYLLYMEKAGMVSQLKTAAKGLGAMNKVEKLYLDNPNLIYALSEGKEDIGNVRETFFLNQMRVNSLVTSSPTSDFQIDDMTFEVGGKSKGKKQIESANKGYVVKDNIEYAHGNVIPLWAFGLNY